jgi:hypothetical protein
MTDLTETIDKFLQEANECEMLGGLAATHGQRVAYRERAERLRILASEAHLSQVLLDALANRFEEQTCAADHFRPHDTAIQ